MITLFPKDKPSILDSEPSLLDRLKNSVSKTRSEIATRIEGLFSGGAPDAEELRRLENALLAADLGVRTTKELVEAVREQSAREPLSDPAALRAALKESVACDLERQFRRHRTATRRPMLNLKPEQPKTIETKRAQSGVVTPANVDTAAEDLRPRVILIVGVNGTGKTTTIGKLAHRLRKQGASVLLGAGDTFARRPSNNLPSGLNALAPNSFSRSPGPIPPPSSTTRSPQPACAQYRCRDSGHRWPPANQIQPHGRTRQRSSGTAARLVPGAPHEVLLGARRDHRPKRPRTSARVHFRCRGHRHCAHQTGRHCAHGGIVVPIMRELGLPVRFVGTGETADDLVPFDAETFVNSIFD